MDILTGLSETHLELRTILAESGMVEFTIFPPTASSPSIFTIFGVLITSFWMSVTASFTRDAMRAYALKI